MYAKSLLIIEPGSVPFTFNYKSEDLFITFVTNISNAFNFLFFVANFTNFSNQIFSSNSIRKFVKIIFVCRLYIYRGILTEPCPVFIIAGISFLLIIIPPVGSQGPGRHRFFPVHIIINCLSNFTKIMRSPVTSHCNTNTSIRDYKAS